MSATEDKKRKKSHYFETYICKVLKQVSQGSGITNDAKQQLNSFLFTLAKIIASISIRITMFAKKKTITEKEVCNSITFVLTNEILTNCIAEGDKAVSNFEDKDEAKKVHSTRQTKANIIFPPSIAEKFLRNFGNSKLFIKSTAPVFLAAVLEYITADILSNTVILCSENKHNRITVHDLEISMKSDVELEKMLSKTKFTFLGGGVIKFIHPSLLRKNKAKIKKRATSTHRYRPGTVAIREIKKNQKNSENLIFAKSTFESIIRTFFKDNTELNSKISADVFIILQHFVEQYLVKLLYNANFIAIHSGRVKLTGCDIALTSYFIGETKNPYLSVVNDSNIELETSMPDNFMQYNLEFNNSEQVQRLQIDLY